MCPNCQRLFGRRNQSHECLPAKSVDEYFSERPDWERPIFDAIRDHLDLFDDVTIEAVEVGIFFKRRQMFAELRPRKARLTLMVLVSRRIRHPRFVKRWEGPGTRSAYFIDLQQPAEVDDEVRDWLTEAYLASPV